MSTHRARLTALALSSFVLPSVVAAQVVMSGARVRVVDVSNSSLVMEGELVRMVGDSVTISTAANLASSGTRSVWVLGGQRRLEVRTALHRQTTIGELTGGLVGAVAGAVIGAASYTPCVPSSGFLGGLNCIGSPDQGSVTAIGAMGGLLAGAVIGGIIGHGIKTETWQRVDRPSVRVGIAPSSRGMLFTASVAF